MGARMIDFGGWDMPVQYPAGTIEEHLTVRRAVGLFDVSHMGELEIRGRQALDLVQRVTSNDASRLSDGQIQYSALTSPHGGFIDDILVHRFASDHYFICVNASNADKDDNWVREHAGEFDAEVINRSADFSQLAVQGPQALALLRTLTNVRLDSIRYYWFTRGEVAGIDCIISRTGYTGEDGFELYCNPANVEALWNRIIEAGEPLAILPCGLAARNTLRLEAKMALYGNDIDTETTVLEADLAWIFKPEKGDFIGRDRLLEQKDAGITRKLVGFEVVGAGIARDHYPAFVGDRQAGIVTSGSPAPFLRRNIGLAYLPIELTAIGTPFEIDVRGRRINAIVVQTPFYKRAR